MVDYTTTSGTLVLTNGAAIGYFAVPISANNLAQTSNRTFTVSLSNPTPPGQLVPPVTETITIIETNTPHGLSFFSPIVITGDWGSTNADNTASSPDSGTPNIAGNAPNAPVWFQWTAPASGEVTLDTIGSLATNGLKLDTVLAVFTGNVLNGLNQVAANDDLYPLPFPPSYGQINETAQNIYNVTAPMLPPVQMAPAASAAPAAMVAPVASAVSPAAALSTRCRSFWVSCMNTSSPLAGRAACGSTPRPAPPTISWRTRSPITSKPF